jgi:phosphoglycerate dehydrogenase-like enzyme
MRMKVFMVGEAGRYAEIMRRALPASIRDALDAIGLPREAAHSDAHDGEIRPGDIVVSLRLRRDGRGLPPMRLLHVPGAGLDGIDLEALAPTTTVCNVFEHEGPIAEFVLASVLEWEIGLAALRASFTPERWSSLYRARSPHGEIRGKTLGILGFGQIGRAIAERARPFGMRLLALDPAGGAGEEILPPARLPTLLERADYVVAACPLTDETRGMIDRDAIERMKPSAVLVNVSRAEIVEEAALYAALREQRIRGASLDVWYRYPSGGEDEVEPAAYPFHALPNVICTPHSAAWTHELMERRYAVIAANIAAIVLGGPLQNVVHWGSTARARSAL